MSNAPETPQSSAWAGTRLGDRGPQFIWLHGWGQTHASLTRVATLLKGRGRHWLLDQPGFGDTPQLVATAGTADYADALHAQWQNQGLEGPALLVGHSFGMRVAVQLAARHPERVKAIICIAGAGLKRKRSLAWTVRATHLKLLGRLARLVDHVFGTEYVSAYQSRYGSADYKAAGALRQTFVRVVNEHLNAEAESITVPVLLLYGSNDSETPPEIGAAFKDLMADASLTVLDGYGHLDILDRGAYQLEAHITAFLEDKSRAL